MQLITAPSSSCCTINTLSLRQNGCHFADDTFKHIFLNENVGISIKISLKFVPKGPINSIPALVQIMAWRRPGNKPLSAPMMVKLLTHICITWPRWVKQPVDWFNIKMLSYQYKDSHYKDEMVMIPPHLYNGNLSPQCMSNIDSSPSVCSIKKLCQYGMRRYSIV